MSEQKKVTIIFVTAEGEKIEATVPVGMNVLDAAREVGAPLPGVCEASLACSTCHVIVEDDTFFSISKKNLEGSELSEDEEDLLDMAPEVEPNSRLGCQIILTEEMDGMVLRIPSSTRNDA